MKKSYRRLAIDTATKYIYLSLVVDDQEVASIYERGDNDHSVTIMPYLKEILDKENLSLKAIDEVIVGIGPGSYTGVRIGVTVAKMIAYLNQIKLTTISSLALMASVSDSDYILPLIDARRGNGFMALFSFQDQLTYVKEDTLQNIESFKKAIDVNYQVVEEGKPNIGRIIQSNLCKQVTDVHDLVPNYLQVTEAERNLKNA